MEVHNRVRQIRQAQGKTISGMATALGMSRQTVYDIETVPTYNPSVHLMARIADYLGVGITELFDAERVA